MRHLLNGIPYLVVFPVLAFVVTGALALMLMKFDVAMQDALLSPLWLSILAVLSFGVVFGCWRWCLEWAKLTKRF